MISLKTWETLQLWLAKYYLSVAVRASKSRMLKLPIRLYSAYESQTILLVSAGGFNRHCFLTVPKSSYKEEELEKWNAQL